MVVDLFLVYQFIRRLATPFNKWEAYKLGIIDENGKVLIKSKEFTNSRQRKAWGVYDRMIANLKKLLAKVPGGSSRFASYAAALFLIKEYKAFTDESLLNENITDKQLDESTLLFYSRYNYYTTLSESVNQLNEKADVFLEKLKASDDMGDWVKDFQDSDAPQFKGKSKEKRRQMAIAAKLGAEEKNEESATPLRNIKLIDKIKKSGVVKSGSMSKKVDTKPELEEEPANNVGSGNIAGMDGGHMSKAGQKKWVSQNKSKKKNIRDIIGDKI